MDGNSLKDLRKLVAKKKRVHNSRRNERRKKRYLLGKKNILKESNSRKRLICTQALVGKCYFSRKLFVTLENVKRRENYSMVSINFLFQRH